MKQSATAATMPDVIHTGKIGNWTRARPSFLALIKHLDPTSFCLFWGVVDATIGHGRPWAKLSWKYFEKISGRSRRWCEEARSKLLGQDEDDPSTFNFPLIRMRKVDGGYEYGIVARPDGDQTGIAKCRNCGQTDEVDLDGEFVPVLHSYLLVLAACTPAELAVVTIVMRLTARAGKGGELDVHPKEISLETFRQSSGYERSELLQAITTVQGPGYELVGSEKCGHITRYWLRPENFDKVAARATRKVKQPKRERKNIETEKPENPVEPVERKQTILPIRPVEFVTQPCGVCRSCHHYGPVDLLPEAQQTVKKPLDRARAGPEGQPLANWPKMKPDNWKKEA